MFYLNLFDFTLFLLTYSVPHSLQIKNNNNKKFLLNTAIYEAIEAILHVEDETFKNTFSKTHLLRVQLSTQKSWLFILVK